MSISWLFSHCGTKDFCCDTNQIGRHCWLQSEPLFSLSALINYIICARLMAHHDSTEPEQLHMLLLKDECSLCKRIVSSSILRRCLRCSKLYCFDCTTFTKEGDIVCLNCARRMVSPKKLGTKYSPLSRYLLKRGRFTDFVVLPIAEVEGIIGDNLPFGAVRDPEWWANTRGSAQGRAWINVGWEVQDVDLNNRTVTFTRVVRPEIKLVRKKIKENKQTPFFKQPLRRQRRKRPALPSKTKVAQAQARLRNVERQRMASQPLTGKFSTKSAYEKRLFKLEAKPSKATA